MKFGRQLLDQIVDEWRNNYVDYYFCLHLLVEMFPKYKNEELTQFRSRRQKILKQRQQAQTAASLPLHHEHEQKLALISPAHASSSSSSLAINTNDTGSSSPSSSSGTVTPISSLMMSPTAQAAAASIYSSHDNGNGNGDTRPMAIRTDRTLSERNFPGMGMIRSLPLEHMVPGASTKQNSFTSVIPSPDHKSLARQGSNHALNAGHGHGITAARKDSANAITVPLLTLDRNSARPRVGINNYEIDDDDNDDNDYNDIDSNHSEGSSGRPTRGAGGANDLSEPLLLTPMSPMSLHAAALVDDNLHHQTLTMSPSSIQTSYAIHGVNGSGHGDHARGLSDDECNQRRQMYSNWTHEAKATEFEAELSRELHKVEVFYLDMEKTLARELAALKIPASQLHVSDTRTVMQVKQGLISLFRRLHQLLNFRTINIVGLERLAEDFDVAAKTRVDADTNRDRSLCHAIGSHIMVSGIQSSTVVPDTIADVISSFAHIFEKGNQVRAKTKLTSRMTKYDYKIKDYIKLGIKIGAVFVLILWAIVELLQWLADPVAEELHPVYVPVYQAFGLVVTFLWLWGLDIWIWTKWRVNYVFIFEFNPRTRLSHQQVFQEAGTVSIVFLSNLVIHFFHGHLGLPWARSVYPLTVFIFFMWKLLFPWQPATHWQSRRVLLRSLANIMIAPFGRVTFRDIFIADCLTSMVKVFVDFYFVACYYGTTSFISTNNASKSCDSGKWIAVPIISCLPLWWRFQQCIKRYFETRQAWPHLANASKYALSHTIVIMAAFHSSFKGSFDTYRVVWLLLCVASSSYSCFWDFKMDWGLLRNGFRHRHPFLRDQLMYPVPVYYIVMALNMIMRFLWLFTILPFGENPFFTGAKWLPPVVIFVEIYRRCQWAVIRTEWQHLNDEEKLRKTQHVPVIIDDSGAGAQSRKLTLRDSKVVLEMFLMVVLLVFIGVASAYL